MENLHPIKFSEEYTHSGTIYYEPVNAEAHEVMDFLQPEQCLMLNEIRAEKIFDWLEKMGHEVMIVQSKDYKNLRGGL